MGVSQEDINNLLEGSGAPPPPGGGADADIQEKYREGFAAHINNIFATLTGMEVKVTVEGDEIVQAADAAAKLPGEWFGFIGRLNAGADIPTGHLISLPLASLIASKMMGAGEPSAVLEEAQLGALKEVGGNLLGAWATGLGEMTGQDIKTVGDATLLEGDVAASLTAADGFAGDNLLIWRYQLTVNGTEGKYILVLPEKPANELAMIHPEYSKGIAAQAAPEAASKAKGKAALEVEKAVFQEFEGDAATGYAAHIDLLLDVPLTVSVELGRKKLTIREILDFVPGSLLELDKLAGEPVDLMVNGRLFAQGEVVVIDENFGVRITSIISPKERLERLK